MDSRAVEAFMGVLGRFYDYKLAQVSDYPRAYKEGMLPTTPVVVARFRMDAPYPDLEVVVPITHESAKAWQSGDRTVARSVAEEMVSHVERTLRRLKQGEPPV